MAFAIDSTLGVTFPDGNTQAISMGYPVGEVCFFAMNSAPTGFLACSGQAVSRTTYARLFAVIGTTYGAGDGSTTFNLPELRGEFIRGWDGGRGVDSGRGFASSQTDALQGHKHETLLATTGGINAFGTGGTAIATDGASAAASKSTSLTNTPYTDGTNGTPRTAAETRPRNVALLACIRF